MIEDLPARMTATLPHAIQPTADTLRGSHMRGLKAFLSTTALLAPLALLPMASAQISINIGGAPPVCSYGYYGYAPYACAPVGYYGPGYFYNGIFLGMGPWAGWGYNHGWGSHRFSNSGGGRYSGGFHGSAANRGRTTQGSVVRTNSRGGSLARTSAGSPHVAAARGSASHGAPHAAAARGGASHGASHASASQGGGSHGGEKR
jgi:hypothetical protein